MAVQEAILSCGQLNLVLQYSQAVCAAYPSSGLSPLVL
jgi:hypothetical protein